jgi:hypothetical protein
MGGGGHGSGCTAGAGRGKCVRPRMGVAFARPSLSSAVVSVAAARARVSRWGLATSRHCRWGRVPLQ